MLCLMLIWPLTTLKPTACTTDVEITLSFGGKSWPINVVDMNLGPIATGSSRCLGGIFDLSLGSSIVSGGGNPNWVVGDVYLVGAVRLRHRVQKAHGLHSAKRKTYTPYIALRQLRLALRSSAMRRGDQVRTPLPPLQVLHLRALQLLPLPLLLASLQLSLEKLLLLLVLRLSPNKILRELRPWTRTLQVPLAPLRALLRLGRAKTGRPLLTVRFLPLSPRRLIVNRTSHRRSNPISSAENLNKRSVACSSWPAHLLGPVTRKMTCYEIQCFRTGIALGIYNGRFLSTYRLL